MDKVIVETIDTDSDENDDEEYDNFELEDIEHIGELNETSHFEELIEEINNDISLDDILSKHEENKNKLMHTIGLNVIEIKSLQRDLMKYKLKINNINAAITLKNQEQHKIIDNYFRKNILKDIDEIKSKYSDKEIMDTIKVYTEDNNIKLSEFDISSLIYSSAGFEGWFKSIKY